MYRIIVQGTDNVIKGLEGMATEIPVATQRLLDEAALETRERMAATAPYNLGNLSRSITISMPDSFSRIIEPMARNVQPGNLYGLPVETGSGPGYLPNPISIATNLGVSTKMGWAIALAIKNRGTPSNPFVERTFTWVRGQLERQVMPFLTQITARFAVGGRA